MKNFRQKKIIFGILTAFFLILLFSPLLTLATCTGVACVNEGLNVTATKAGIQEQNDRDLPTVIGQAINYIFGVVGVIFLAIILVGGYLWMTAGGSEEKIAKAKGFIINGITGMIVIFLAYALVYVMLAALGGATGST